MTDMKPVLEDQERLINKLQTELDSYGTNKENLEKNRDELKNKSQEVIDRNKTLTENYEKQISELKSEFEKKLKKAEEDVNPLRKENSFLKNRMKGLENTIKVISEWSPSQKESIEVLVVPASAPDEFHELKDIMN